MFIYNNIQKTINLCSTFCSNLSPEGCCLETNYEPLGWQTKNNDEIKVACRKLVRSLNKACLTPPLLNRTRT